MDILLVLLPVVPIVLVAATMLRRGDRRRIPGSGIPRSWVAGAAVGCVIAVLVMAAAGATGGRVNWGDALTVGLSGLAIALALLLLLDRFGHPQT